MNETKTIRIGRVRTLIESLAASFRPQPAEPRSLMAPARPMHAPPAPSNHPDSWRERELQPGKLVMVVEDDEEFLALVTYMFRDYDCEVVECKTAEEALLVAEQRRPDLLMIDYGLPGMNGFELIETLRGHEAFRSIPRVMFTGAADAEALQEAVAWETAAFLAKPLRKVSVLETVQRALGGSLPKRETPPEDNGKNPAMRASELEVQRLKADIKELLRQGLAASKAVNNSGPAQHSLVANPNDAPIVKLVNGVLLQAARRKASDIHVEPQQHHLVVRLRIDGELVPVVELPCEITPAVVARLKIMASLNIAERRLPQDGRFTLPLDPEGRQKVEFRVSTLPSQYGEKVVLRLLSEVRVANDLSQVFLWPRDLDWARASLASPNGLILLTGPTGSGKTSTLYAMLSSLNTPARNIITVEDPIEAEIPGVTQVAVNAEIGLTFEKSLRAFLRQDPDVMLVGEIRDRETADIAIRAAITGRLILSTLHTNDAATTISRLVNMGVADYLIAASLRLVVAQRLVRRLCANCKIKSQTSEAERSLMTDMAVFRPVGCEDCGGIGYLGRVPVCETMAITPSMRELIRSNGSSDAIRELAVKEGMRTMQQAVLALVADGETAPTEALKVLTTD